MKRDTLIVLGVAVILAIIGVLFFVRNGSSLYSPVSSNAVASQSSAVIVPFTKLVEGIKSTVEKRANYLITSSTELNDLWKLIDATSTPPTIDFKTSAVLAVFAGTESTSSIEIAKIEDSGARMVSIVITKPDSTCAQHAPATPSSYEVVVVPLTSLSLTHEDVLTTASCPK